MISIPVNDRSGAEVGTYEFDEADLAPKGVNKQLLHDVVVMYEANRRVGTAATKSRGMVAGSTKKLFRQKGTGRARMGASRTPIRRGGGHAFGKVARDFSYRLPRKAVRAATRMALLSKFLDDQARVVDEFSLDVPKTSEVVRLLRALGVAEVSCLLAIDGYDSVVWRSGRNVSTLAVSPVADLNAYDLLRQRQLVVTRAGLDFLLGRSVESQAVSA